MRVSQGAAKPSGRGFDATVEMQLERILASRRFAGSERHCRLLRYLLDQTVAGVPIRERTLGVEVFERGESFDSHTDPIVRTELSRLRAKLTDYYESEGRGDALIIELPKKSYTLAFKTRPDSAPAAAPAPTRGWIARRWAPLAGALALATVAGWLVLGLTGHRLRGQGPAGNYTTVAVLPFANLSGDPESDYLSEGLTEELIHWLAEVEGLRVVGRTSAFQFKSRNEDLRSIAARLNAAVVLEGTVRRSGGRVRITSRLVDAADGYELRSDIWDRGSEDILAVEEEVARQVANTLRVHHKRAGGRTSRAPNNIEAYRLYFQGLHHANLRTEAATRKAIEFFERAIAADPEYAPAHASLADAQVVLALLNEAPPRAAMPRAKQAAQRAASLGHSFSHAHSALGSVLALYDWDWAGAEREFRKAVELDPNDPGILESYALRFLLPRGRLDAALFQLQLAQSLDPFSPTTLWSIAQVQNFKREPDRAIQTLQKVLHQEPRFEVAPMALANAYIQKSMFGLGLKTLAESSAATEDEARLAAAGHAYALSGQPDRARQVLQQLRALSGQQYVSGYYFAPIHLALGDRTAALEALESAAAERSPLVVYLGVNPLFDGLRGEPRFRAILSHAGLN